MLALAYKRPRSDEEGLECEESRAVAEQGLCFAGFVAFSCRVRKDTRSVVLQLREGAHSVAMVTGDAILTALHVANEVNRSRFFGFAWRLFSVLFTTCATCATCATCDSAAPECRLTF